MAVTSIQARSLQAPQGATWAQLIWHHGIVVPWQAVKQWAALALLTSGPLYGSAQFNMLHGVFPAWVAVPTAIGIEWSYLSGLAYVSATKQSSLSKWMISVGAGTSGLNSVLYIMGHYKAIPAVPTPEQAFWLALAHVVPLIALLFLYTLAKQEYMLEQLEIIDIEQQLKLDTERRIAEAKTAAAIQEIEAAAEANAELLRIQNEYRRQQIRREARNANAQNASLNASPENAISSSTKPENTPEKFMQNCVRCGAMHEWSRPQQFSASGRWGCPSCKKGRNR